MKNLKKVVLYISGPGVVAMEVVALFIHLFTGKNARFWIIGGLIVFFVIFIPFYSVEYYNQNLKSGKDKKPLHFKRKKNRTEWEGGNIHGKTPANVDRPGRIFNK